MCKRQCPIMAHVRETYGSCVWTEESPWPILGRCCEGDFLEFPTIETATGQIPKEKRKLEVLSLSKGCPAATFISGLPFVDCFIEIQRTWTLAIHNIVAQFLLNGVLIAVTGETANVRACVTNLKVAR